MSTSGEFALLLTVGIFCTLQSFIGIVLCILLRDYQPLRSKSFLPVLVLIGNLIWGIVQIAIAFTELYGIPIYAHPYCINLFVTLPIQLFYTAVSVFILFRYVVINNLVNLKLDVRKHGKKFVGTGKYKFLILRALTKWYTVTISLIAVFGLYALGQGILWAVVKECPHGTKGNAISLPITIVIFAFVILFGVATVIADLYFHWDMLKGCNLKKFFFFSDPFHFRWEFLFFVIFSIFNISFSSIFSAVDPDRLVISFGMRQVIYTIIIILLNFSLPGISVMMTVRNYIQMKKSPVRRQTPIFQEISNKRIRSLFEAYAKSEWSLENIYCMEEILKFEKNPTKEQALSICKTFLAVSSVYECNVPKKDTKEVLQRIENNNIDAHLFDKIKDTINTNLLDTWQRFQKLQEYQKIKAVTDIAEEMKKDAGMNQ